MIKIKNKIFSPQRLVFQDAPREDAAAGGTEGHESPSEALDFKRDVEPRMTDLKSTDPQIRKAAREVYKKFYETQLNTVSSLTALVVIGRLAESYIFDSSAPDYDPNKALFLANHASQLGDSLREFEAYYRPTPDEIIPITKAYRAFVFAGVLKAKLLENRGADQSEILEAYRDAIRRAYPVQNFLKNDASIKKWRDIAVSRIQDYKKRKIEKFLKEDEPNQRPREMREFTNSSQLTDLLKRGKFVFIFITAPSWCKPCRAMEPIMEEVNKKLGSLGEVLRIRTDRDPKTGKIEGGINKQGLKLLKKHFDISMFPESMPTIWLVYKQNGRVQGQANNGWDADQIVNFVVEHKLGLHPTGGFDTY